MTIRRKQENETEEQQRARIAKTNVSNFPPRSEKTSWNRKRNNLEKYVSENVQPLETQVIALKEELGPHYDEIAKKRKDMVESCIHPYDELRYDDEARTVTCTFCGKRFNPNVEADGSEPDLDGV